MQKTNKKIAWFSIILNARP